MTLTPKQEKFAQLVASGMTQADAYRHAYNAENMADSTILSMASLLAADGKVSGRIKALHEAALLKQRRWIKALQEAALLKQRS